MLMADRVLLADWVEASILLHEPVLYGAELLDSLREDEQADDDDDGWRLVSDIWDELRRRRRSHHLSSITIDERVGQYRVARNGDWKDSAAHAFTLWCSVRPHYPDPPDWIKHDHVKQGALWERVTHAGLTHTWPDWTALSVGWSPSQPQKMLAVAHAVARALGEPVSSPERIAAWTPKEAKDAGLDLVLYRAFPDGLTVPRYFGQAASGVDWVSKTGTPHLSLWNKVIDWAIWPSLLMAIPFCIAEGDFARLTLSTDGLLLDRHRILPDGPEATWLPDDVHADLVAYLEPRVAWLLEGAILHTADDD
jgi:hypothetical protein